MAVDGTPGRICAPDPGTGTGGAIPSRAEQTAVDAG